MSDEQQNNQPETPEDDAATVTAEAKGEADARGTDPLALIRAENAELKDRYLRLAAEMENLRRRTARDVRDAKSFSIAGFARDMLQVSDNLRRALDSVPEQTGPDHAGDTVDNGLAALAEGVDLTERAMLAAFERHGVRRIEPKGQRFDPNFHQAMYEVPNPDIPNNTVVEVIQPGYVIGERMLRPAMVGVSKGGPKEAASEPAAEAAAATQDADRQA